MEIILSYLKAKNFSLDVLRKGSQGDSNHAGDLMQQLFFVTEMDKATWQGLEYNF